MNAKYIRAKWSDAGAMLVLFLDALFMSAWNGGRGLNAHEMLANSFTAFYFVLFQVALQVRRHKEQWQSHFLPLRTVRCVLYLIANAAQGIIHWPKDVVFAPECRQEQASERHFSALKGYFRGSPSIRDYCVAADLVHMEQVRRGVREATEKEPHGPLPTESEIPRIAKAALADAAFLQACICVDTKPQEEYNMLLQWWGSGGFTTLFGADAAAEEEEEEDDEDEELPCDALCILALSCNCQSLFHPRLFAASAAHTLSNPHPRLPLPPPKQQSCPLGFCGASCVTRCYKRFLWKEIAQRSCSISLQFSYSFRTKKSCESFTKSAFG